MQKHLIHQTEWVKLFKQMVCIRLFEEAVEQAMQQGHIHGTTHLYNGQEAVAVGVCSQLKKGDTITSTHRGHGHAIAMGASLHKMMAELFGKKTGYSKGKGGSMHIANIEDGNLGSNGVVGAGIPIAAGAALSAQLRNTNAVSVAFFGDGATNEGSFHETLNIASIWKLPVIFVCENNEYGMSSAIHNMTNVPNLALRAKAYGIPGITINGNDVLEVAEIAKRAIKDARSGKGPTLIEAKTYRFKGHSRSDKEVYRTKDEIARYKKRDPIVLFEKKLVQEKVLNKIEIITIKEAIHDEVKRAVRFALESEEPALEDLFKDVYA